MEVYRLVIEPPSDHEEHKVSVHFFQISSIMLPCLALPTIMAESSNMLNVLKGRGLSCRDRNVRTHDIREHVCFYSNLRWSRVHVNMSARWSDYAFVEKVKLEESFVNLFLRHIVLQQPKLAMLNYYVANTNIHRCMVAQLHE